jgi:hypothetical protein
MMYFSKSSDVVKFPSRDEKPDPQPGARLRLLLPWLSLTTSLLPPGLNSGPTSKGGSTLPITTSHQILHSHTHSHGQFLLTKTYISLASIGLHDQCTLRPLVKSQAARQDRIMLFR